MAQKNLIRFSFFVILVVFGLGFACQKQSDIKDVPNTTEEMNLGSEYNSFLAIVSEEFNSRGGDGLRSNKLEDDRDLEQEWDKIMKLYDYDIQENFEKIAVDRGLSQNLVKRIMELPERFMDNNIPSVQEVSLYPELNYNEKVLLVRAISLLSSIQREEDYLNQDGLRSGKDNDKDKKYEIAVDNCYDVFLEDVAWNATVGFISGAITSASGGPVAAGVGAAVGGVVGVLNARRELSKCLDRAKDASYGCKYVIYPSDERRRPGAVESYGTYGRYYH